ncbi:DUF6497 family protein [Aliiroseovarius sp. KMU-50]|uniref:DUF6497 family protein n=1 Tax=Aliiroseovarius salicola TaxID=3009082 RepID=A0ABT4VZI3_9RHOB|nr:DUF6497 family protein [Aliiroseovarius sp. KMU-50]MDA5093621.1 DUF6497 family protein [Aliiroseovarius sp. KMU-50]
MLAQTYQGRFGQVGGAIFAALLSLTVPLSAPAQASSEEPSWGGGGVLTVPSGQPVELLDVISGMDSALGTAIRYRFVAPQIARDGGNIAFSQTEEDMVALCQNYVLPQLVADAVDLPDQIIIVLTDREVEFGVADPAATQYFEAYRPEDGACFWEGF